VKHPKKRCTQGDVYPLPGQQFSVLGTPMAKSKREGAKNLQGKTNQAKGGGILTRGTTKKIERGEKLLGGRERKKRCDA